MKTSLPQWANIAEIVSGVAVVLTLVFLVVGIRENNEIARAAAYDSHLSSVNELRRNLLNDTELMLVWEAYRNGESGRLSEIERIRLEYQLNIQWAVYEKAWFAYQYGIIGDSEWTRFARVICLNSNLLRSNGLEQTVRPQLTERFIGYVERTCAP